jgi:hypothetical protein
MLIQQAEKKNGYNLFSKTLDTDEVIWLYQHTVT